MKRAEGEPKVNEDTRKLIKDILSRPRSRPTGQTSNKEDELVRPPKRK